jgi:hypothetical protein
MNTTSPFQMLALTLLLATPSRLNDIISNKTSGPKDLDLYMYGVGFSPEARDAAGAQYFGDPTNSLDQPLSAEHLSLLKGIATKREMYDKVSEIIQATVSFYDGSGYHPTNHLDNPGGTPQDESIVAKARALDGQ